MSHIQLRQLDQQLKEAKKCLLNVVFPFQGWIKTIRTTLKMTTRQLGNKVQKTQQQISALEKREREKSITLRSLEEIAQALNCKVHYVFIPEENLERQFQNQLLKKAQEEIAYISHSMSLESQGTSQEELNYQLIRIVQQLEQKNTQRIWDTK